MWLSYPLGEYMSGRLLDFKNYLGGAASVQVIEMFPNDQKSFTYDYNTDVSGYTFTADYQSILLDSVGYDRATGNVNLADTNVTGYFTNTNNVDMGTYFSNASAAAGSVTFTIPADRYTGNVLPNARENVVCTVLSFQWQTDDTPPQKERHRWAILERFDPQIGKTPGNPKLETTFVPFGVGAITGVTDSGADASRLAGTYTNVTGLTSGSGSGATFEIVVAPSTGALTVNITARGTGYVVGDTIEILDSSLGAGGAADVTLTVSSIA